MLTCDDGEVKQPFFSTPLMNLGINEKVGWAGVANLVLGRDNSIPLTKMMLRKKFEDQVHNQL